MFVWILLGILVTTLLAGMLTAFSFRFLVKKIFRAFIHLIETEPFSQNLWETVSLAKRMDPQTIVENGMRAEGGVLIKRPFGSPRKMPHFNQLLFMPKQLAQLPTADEAFIDTKTVIGPAAKRPLELEIPIIVTGMAYGLALSEKVKIALAKGATMAGTATNAGEGAVLPEERGYAKKLIMQYSRAKWGKDPELLKQADMIEIHIGQGSSGASPSQVPGLHLKGKAGKLMGVSPEETATIHAQMPGISRPRDWRRLVDRLRRLTDGVPIGMKIIPGRVEKDIEVAIQAGVDFITIDGAQAATKGTPPILQDDLGLPTVIGLCRAAEYLEKRGVKKQISLIVSGGLKSPGDYLKALALGADAVALGASLIFAVSHLQGTGKALPWEPPTQLVYYSGSIADQFNVEMGAKYLSNALFSIVDEMKLGVIALGKTSVHDLDKSDLVALDPLSAAIANVPLM